MKAFLKFIKYSLLTFGLLILLLAGLAYTFKDKIISLTLNEMNRYLATKIEVDKDIQLTLFAKFPQVSLKFKNVKIHESFAGSSEKLAELKSLYFAFNAIDFIQGRYVLENIYAEHGSITIRINPNGIGNYHIIKTDSSNSSDQTLAIDLKNIYLKDVTISYDNFALKQNHKVHAHELSSSLKINENVVSIGLNGDAIIHYAGIEGNDYFKDKAIHIVSKQEYFFKGKVFKILPSEVLVEGSEFNLTGLYEGDNKFIELDLKAKKATISTLVSLLPGKVSNQLKEYNSSGNIFFDAKVKGTIDAVEKPSVTVDFGFENASFSHPGSSNKIEQATLHGKFYNGPDHNLSSSSIQLSNIKALFDGRDFTGDIHIINLEEPFLKAKINGTIDLNTFSHFIPKETIAAASGLVELAIDFEGKIADLKTKETQKEIKAEGIIGLKDINLELTKSKTAIRSLNGNFVFNKTDISIHQLSTVIGESDFQLKGSLKNLVIHMLTGKESITINGEILSNKINLNQLVTTVNSLSATGDSTSQNSSSSDNNNLTLALQFNIKNLDYNKLKARELSGNFDFKNNIASIRNTSLTTAGGKVNTNTTFDMRAEKRIAVNTNTALNSIHIDSILYICENFNQDFIKDKNLKGQYTGNINCSFVMDKNYSILTETIMATIDATIKNGELNNFEPMKKMARFIDERELENIRFSELKNKIIIENNVITIPEMEIKSNISIISVMGTHTFDQKMDYKLAIPLKDFKKKHPDKDQAFGNIEEDTKGNSLLFLTIKGTTSDYKIAYDTKRTGNKIKEDLKKEKQELQRLFHQRREQQTEKIAAPSETEFFDF